MGTAHAIGDPRGSSSGTISLTIFAVSEVRNLAASRGGPNTEEGAGYRVPAELHGEFARGVHDDHVAIGFVGRSKPLDQVVGHQ